MTNDKWKIAFSVFHFSFFIFHCFDFPPQDRVVHRAEEEAVEAFGEFAFTCDAAGVPRMQIEHFDAMEAAALEQKLCEFAGQWMMMCRIEIEKIAADEHVF